VFLIIKQANDKIALERLLRLVNQVVEKSLKCKKRNHPSLTLIYISSYMISLSGISEPYDSSLKSLKDTINTAAVTCPERFICILRTSSPVIFGNKTLRDLQASGINAFRPYCYTKVYERGLLVNHAKFVISYHFCFDEEIVDYGNYYGSTNLTRAGLCGKNYEVFHAPDYLKTFNYRQFTRRKYHKYYIRDAYRVVNERVTLYYYPEKLKQHVDKHMSIFESILGQISRVIKHTPIVDLYNAFIEVQRLYLEVLSFIDDLPGRQITSQIINKIESTVEVSPPNVIELEMLETTDENIIRRAIDLLKLSEGDLKEITRKYIKAVESALKIFKDTYDPKHIEKYYDDFEMIFVKRLREYSKHHRELLRNILEGSPY
jgi:hypothetical protein